MRQEIDISRPRYLSKLFAVTSVSAILVPYHRSLNDHIELVNILRPHSVSFEISRDAVAKWVAQPWLEDYGWSAQWEDIFAAEVERWD